MMNRLILGFCFLVLLGSCTKKGEKGPSDTLLNHPLAQVDTARHVSVDSTGLVIDSSRMRTPEHQKLLARFTPVEVATIYHEYRPLRTTAAKKAEIDAFLKNHSLTHEELLAILEEGDLLGWSKPQ